MRSSDAVRNISNVIEENGAHRAKHKVELLSRLINVNASASHRVLEFRSVCEGKTALE